MDSNNSASVQSSSGGDEEYDSRGESMSSFFNPSAPNLINPHPQFLSSSFFDQISQNLPQSLPNQTPTTQYCNDLIWSSGLRQTNEPNYDHLGNLSSFSSSSNQSHQFGGGGGAQVVSSVPSSSSLLMPEKPAESVKNPRKRTRASRRAPTTVLTTDTMNFRQMVQEFTGIPTAPFSGSTYSRRLENLFSPGGSGLRPGAPLDHTLGPVYPLRPSAQKFQISQFAPSTSSPMLNANLIDSLVPPGANTVTTAAVSQNSPDMIGMPKQAQFLLNMQNQILAFQPLMQPSAISSHDEAVNVNNLSQEHNNNNQSDGRFRLNTGSTSEFHPEKGLGNV